MIFDFKKHFTHHFFPVIKCVCHGLLKLDILITFYLCPELRLFFFIFELGLFYMIFDFKKHFMHHFFPVIKYVCHGLLKWAILITFYLYPELSFFFSTTILYDFRFRETFHAPFFFPAMKYVCNDHLKSFYIVSSNMKISSNVNYTSSPLLRQVSTRQLHPRWK